VTIDTVLNTLVLMGAMPEPGTPPDQTHIVRSTAILRDVRYRTYTVSGELVSYESYDPVSSEKIRIQADALSGSGGSGVTVTLDGDELPQVSSARLVTVSGEAAWALNEQTAVLEVRRVTGGRVAIVRL
jgi:hypothetical protein